MRLAIVLLVVVIAGFVVTVVLIGNGATIPGLNPPPTKPDGSVDQDNLSNWHPPSIASLIASAGSMFAPHADFGTKEISVAAGTAQTISAKPSNNNVDIAKIGIATSGALLITYECTHAKDGSSCSQTLCLCTPGSPLTSLAVAFCAKDSQWKQPAAAGICSSDERQQGTVLVYPESRRVALTALGPTVSASLQ